MNLDAWRHYLRARLYAMLRRRDAAAAEYRTALRLDPDFARAAHALAFLLAARGAHAEAEQWFRAVLRSQPGNAAAWFNLGFLHDKAGDTQKAIDAFREAARLDAKIDRAWYGLGLALATLGRHDEAATALEEAARLQPMNPHAWYHLGLAYHALHNPGKVEEIALHLNRFDRKMTHRLILDTGRADLAHLVADYKHH